MPSPLKLTAQQVARHAFDAGFRGEALVTAVAVARGESGFDAHALGDTTITTAKWGPSVGLWQIRSLRAEFGTKRTRDEAALYDPAFNARSAYTVSGGGTNFQPWSVFTAGKHRSFMAEAREAASRVQAMPGVGVADGGAPILYTVGAQGPATPIRLGGQRVAGDLGSKLLGGTVDLSVDEVSEITLVFEDGALDLLDKWRVGIDAPLDFLDLRFQVISVELGQADAGAQVTVIAHPAGAVRMRTISPNPASSISPTDYMRAAAVASGLGFHGEPSAARGSIGPTEVDDPERGQRPETAWEVGDRLAAELGFLHFEAAGILHFASPQWLASNSPGKHTFIWSPGGHRDHLVLYEIPTVGLTKVKGRQYRQVEMVVHREHGEQIRPGRLGSLHGLPKPFFGGGLLITRVSWSLTDLVSPVSIGAREPEKLPASARTTEDIRATTGGIPEAALRTGTASALDFVDHCLAQVGDRYVFGAETRLDDPNPDAFDCSELIQWALSRVGIRFVDGSVNQIAACRKAGLSISIDQAAKVRGALLFRKGNPNHIVVSLGDGKNTVEAMGRKYGVVTGKIAGRGWTEAGLVPGLNYGVSVGSGAGSTIKAI